MSSIRFLVLSTFILYGFQCSASTPNIFKPWFMSDDMPSTVKQPTKQQNGVNLSFAPNKENPCSIKTVETVPNANPAQNCREISVTNSEINDEVNPTEIIGFEGNLQIENLKDAVEKWQEAKGKFDQILGIDEIKQRKFLLKSQISDRIYSIILKLKSMHSKQPKPAIMEITDPFWPFLAEKIKSNRYTIVKPSIGDFFSKVLGKPLSESANNGKTISTIVSITTEKPMPTTERQTTVIINDPIVSTTTVIGNDPTVDTTTGNPSTTPSVPQPEAMLALPIADVVATEQSKPEGDRTHGVDLGPKNAEGNQNKTAEDKTREPVPVVMEIPQPAADNVITPVVKPIIEDQKTLSKHNTDPNK